MPVACGLLIRAEHRWMPMCKVFPFLTKEI
jgi:hypothetical protein